jgi:hypothetical protein
LGSQAPGYNPRAEAVERLGGRYDARVLEPSPPAVTEPPWFADDPVARGNVPPDRLVVSPVGTGDVRWEELAAEDAALAQWCSDRWLAAHRRLGPVPPALATTRAALHALAERAISPARRHANGKIGLRYTRGGFGTPFFADDVQIRVEGSELVVQAAAVELVGPGLLPPDLDAGDEALEVDPDAAAMLGDWFGFAASVLEELRAEVGEPSRVQLWPEHFDLAVELGHEDDGSRATYGLSPGDEEHPEPYVYVAPWVAPAPGELWQAVGFTGAELRYDGLVEAEDQRLTTLDFLRARFAALAG